MSTQAIDLTQMNGQTAQKWNRLTNGSPAAPIMIICDPQTEQAVKDKLPMDLATFKWFNNKAAALGFAKNDFSFVSLCPPISEKDQTSAAKKWKHVEPHVAEIRAIIAKHKPKVVVTFGELASRAVIGRAVAITKARGVMVDVVLDGHTQPVIPSLSPLFARRVPDHVPTFAADLGTLARLKDANFDLAAITPQAVDYQWVSDLTEFMASKPRVLYYDTETTGLVWWKPHVKILTVQFCDRPGHAVAVPVHPDYFKKVFPDLPLEVCNRVRAQVKEILGNPHIRKMAHNLKYDHQLSAKEQWEVRGWFHDTQLMAFFVDENLMSKALDDCVRVFVPEMSGYSDEFDQTVDKENMMDVPPEKMLPYACGDVDAGFRLARNLGAIMKKDARQFNCYRRIQFPALLTFANVVERYGLLIDKDHLRSFRREVETFQRNEYRRLVRLIPPALRRKYMVEGLSFSKDSVLREILFSKEGFKLKPVVFTPGTKNNDQKDRIPSVSTKDHLPYFTDGDTPAAQFVSGLIKYQQATKLLTTYIGSEEELTGFWQYIAPDGAIYPSYALHRTVTGRSASDNPNGQNFPKRGDFAKAYSRIFKARPGHKLIAADLSQAELRLAAWMAMEPTMLAIYLADGDIHTTTAKIIMRLSDDEWAALSKKEKKLARSKAKAANFGFLYGMGAKNFREFAKTNYGVDYTEEEAASAREQFFKTYNKLPAWHEAMRSFVQQNGYVRSMHGAVRHLPSIDSVDRAIRSSSERQAINSPIQRMGSDLGLLAMWRFSYQALPDHMHIVGFIHDALVMEVKDGYELEAAQALLYAMEVQPLQEYFGITPPLPIKADAEIGLNFGEMIELGELPDELPEWFEGCGFEIGEKGGKHAALNVAAVRPEWWRDDWKAVEEDFLTRPRKQILTIDA